MLILQLVCRLHVYETKKLDGEMGWGGCQVVNKSVIETVNQKKNIFAINCSMYHAGEYARWFAPVPICVFLAAVGGCSDAPPRQLCLIPKDECVL